MRIPYEKSKERAVKAGRKEPYDDKILKLVKQYYDTMAIEDDSYYVVDAEADIDVGLQQMLHIIKTILDRRPRYG